jgi:hypothetical protein
MLNQLKTAVLRMAPIVIAAVGLSTFAGCSGPAVNKEPAAGKKGLAEGGKIFLTVDFQKAQTLRYKFVSSRETELNWNPAKDTPRANKNAVQKFSESMEMVVAYTPIEVDPYGLTTIKAACESVKVQRSKASLKDAVESLTGKTFTLTIDATGKILDNSQLYELIREAGKKAFRTGGRERTKEPDMIDDFITTQWFLWDSISSIELKDAIKGLSVGQSWKSELPVPTSMVLQKAREVNYTLAEIRPSSKGPLAVIHSSYSPTQTYPSGLPIPYTGRFQLAGPLGFFRTFFKSIKVTSLQGEGEEVFNIDAGRIEQYNQDYQMQLEPAVSLLPKTKPCMIIKQKLTMQLLEDK